MKRATVREQMLQIFRTSGGKRRLWRRWYRMALITFLLLALGLGRLNRTQKGLTVTIRCTVRRWAAEWAGANGD
jgi:hypothetical protein